MWPSPDRDTEDAGAERVIVNIDELAALREALDVIRFLRTCHFWLVEAIPSFGYPEKWAICAHLGPARPWPTLSASP